MATSAHSKQNTTKRREMCPLGENPVRPDPVWKPLSIPCPGVGPPAHSGTDDSSYGSLRVPGFGISLYKGCPFTRDSSYSGISEARLSAQVFWGGLDSRPPLRRGEAELRQRCVDLKSGSRGQESWTRKLESKAETSQKIGNSKLRD